jgi:hypothetical protein
VTTTGFEMLRADGRGVVRAVPRWVKTTFERQLVIAGCVRSIVERALSVAAASGFDVSGIDDPPEKIEEHLPLPIRERGSGVTRTWPPSMAEETDPRPCRHAA